MPEEGGGPGGKEVGRISIRAIPETKHFKQDLEDYLKDIEKELNARIKTLPQTEGFKEKVKAETSELPEAKVKVKPEVSKPDVAKATAEAQTAAAARSVVLSVKPELDKARMARVQAEALAAAKAGQLAVNYKPEDLAKMKADRAAFEAARAAAHAAEMESRIPLNRNAPGMSIVDNAKVQAEALEAARRGELAVKSWSIIGHPELGKFDRARVVAQRAQLEAEVKARPVQVPMSPELHRAKFEAQLAQAKVLAAQAGVKLDVHVQDAAAKAKLDALIARMKTEADLSHIQVRVGVSEAGAAAAFAASRADGGMFRLGDIREFAELPRHIMMLGQLALIAPAVAAFATGLAALPALLTAVAAPLGIMVLGLEGLKKALDNTGLLALGGKKGDGGPKGNKQTAGAVIKALMAAINDEVVKDFTPIFQKLADTILHFPVAPLHAVVDGVASIANALVNVLADPAVMDTFARTLTLIGNTMTQMAPGVTAFATAMVNLVDSGAQALLPMLSGLFNTWAGKFSEWVTSISSSGILDKAIKGIGPILDSIANFAGRLLDTGVKMMSDPEMSKSVVKLIDSLADLTINALPRTIIVLQALTDTLNGLSKAAAAYDKEHAKPGWNWTSAFAVPPAMGAKGGLQLGKGIPGSELLSGGGQIAGGIMNYGTRAYNLGAQGGEKFAAWGGFPKAWDMAYAGVSNFIGKTTAAMARLGDRIGKQFQEDWRVINTGWDTAYAAVTGFVSKAAEAIGRFCERIAGQFVKDWQTISSGWDTAYAAVKGFVEKAVSAVEGLGPKIVSACENFGTLLLNAGEQLLTGLVHGIERGWHWVTDAISKLAKSIPNWFMDLLGIHSPSTVMDYLGQQTAQGLTNGIVTGIDAGTQAVIDKAKALVDQLNTALSNGIAPSTEAGAAEMAVAKAQSMVGESYVAGVSDCSGAVSQVYSAMAGKNVHFTTESNFQSLGFKRGYKEGALNIGVMHGGPGGGHMAATLPNGVNFESGGRLGGGPKYGGGAAGALDPEFTEHWYYEGGSGGPGSYSDLMNQINGELSELKLQTDRLREQLDKTTDKDARKNIEASIKAIEGVRHQLETEKDELKTMKPAKEAKSRSGKDSEHYSEAAAMLAKLIDDAGAMGKKSVDANISQFMTDLGMSGQGAVPVIARTGIDWLTNIGQNLIKSGMGLSGDTHIHVNNVDDALSAKSSLENRQAMQYVGR